MDHETLFMLAADAIKAVSSAILDISDIFGESI